MSNIEDIDLNTLTLSSIKNKNSSIFKYLTGKNYEKPLTTAINAI